MQLTLAMAPRLAWLAILCGPCVGINRGDDGPVRPHNDAAAAASDAESTPNAAPVGERNVPVKPDVPGDQATPVEIELRLAIESVEQLRSHKYLLRAVVENVGNEECHGPLRVVFTGSTEPGFELARPDGRTDEDEPYVEFVRKGRSLAAESDSRMRAIQFELEADDLAEEQLAKIAFEYRILGPGLPDGPSRTTDGRRSQDEDGADDGDSDKDDRTEDGGNGGSSVRDRRSNGADPRRLSNVGPDGDRGRREGLYATAYSIRDGQPVTIAYVVSREAARRLPEELRGRPVVPQLSWPFNLYAGAARAAGQGDSDLVGRAVIGRPGNGPPRAGVVAAVNLTGSVRVNVAWRQVSGLTVVQGVNGAFAGAADVGMPVEDESGEQIGVVVGGNSSYTLLASAKPGDTRRVLFVGNSYTMNNDLPALVAQVAKAAGHTVEVERSLEGGATLRRHLQKGDALTKIKQTKFDVVVLQEQSLTPLLNKAGMWSAATEFDAAITENGAETLFYITWARRGKPEMTKGLADSYDGIAKKLKADVAPVGLAWHDVIENAGLDLHTEDGSHPTAEGSLLAALVFHAKLFNADPRKVPGNFGVPAPRAALLKNAAYDAVRGNAAPKP